MQTAAALNGKADGDINLIHAAHASFERHVLWPRGVASAAQYDVFIHSWNPELGATIDRLYRPTWSLHAPPPQRSGGNRPTASALASLYHVLTAKRQHERKHEMRYDLVWVLRHDLVWFVPVEWQRLPRAQLYFPQQCANIEQRALGFAAKVALGKACLWSGADDGSNRVKGGEVHALRYIKMVTSDHAIKLTLDGDELFVNDWFFAAPSSTADTFRALHTRYDDYIAALQEVGIGITWNHFVWAMHARYALQAVEGIRPAWEAGQEFTLVRLAQSRMCPGTAATRLPGTEPSAIDAPQEEPVITTPRRIAPEEQGKCLPPQGERRTQGGGSFGGVHYVEALSAWLYEIPKSGSTSLMDLFGITHGATSPLSQVAKGDVGFAVVRHPTCRAVSAFSTAYLRAAYRCNRTGTLCPYEKFPYLRKESTLSEALQLAVQTLRRDGAHTAEACGYAYHHLWSQTHFLWRERVRTVYQTRRKEEALPPPPQVLLRLEYLESDLRGFCRSRNASAYCDKMLFERGLRQLNPGKEQLFNQNYADLSWSPNWVVNRQGLTKAARADVEAYYASDFACLGYEPGAPLPSKGCL